MWASRLAKRLRLERDLSIPLDVEVLAGELGIQLRRWPTNGVEAVYAVICGEPYIVIDNRVAANSLRYRCLVGHEIGHHLTLPSGYDGIIFHGSVTEARYERLAFEAAYELMMPAKETKCMWRRACFFDDLVERFRVTPRFAQARIAYLINYSLCVAIGLLMSMHVWAFAVGVWPSAAGG